MPHCPPHPTPLYDSEPWNNTGNQPRPLQLQECKTLSDAPSADPHCLVSAQGLAPPAMHWHNPWPTPVTSLHCSVHSWEDSASPRRACQTAKPRSLQLHVGTDQAQSSITGLYHTHLWLALPDVHTHNSTHTAITSLQWRVNAQGENKKLSVSS